MGRSAVSAGANGEEAAPSPPDSKPEPGTHPGHRHLAAPPERHHSRSKRPASCWDRYEPPGSALLTHMTAPPHAGLQGALCPAAPPPAPRPGCRDQWPRSHHARPPSGPRLQRRHRLPGPPGAPGLRTEPSSGFPVPSAQVSAGCLVPPHGPGSQGPKVTLGRGPAGGSKAAGPGADRPPPSSRTGGTLALQREKSAKARLAGLRG